MKASSSIGGRFPFVAFAEGQKWIIGSVVEKEWLAVGTTVLWIATDPNENHWWILSILVIKITQLELFSFLYPRFHFSKIYHHHE
jgi:hypothetical protein